MSNIWSDFEQLLPKKVYRIGKVVSVDTTLQTSQVTLLSDDNIISVGGTLGAVGVNVLIEDGYIKQTLPELSSRNVTIY